MRSYFIGFSNQTKTLAITTKNQLEFTTMVFFRLQRLTFICLIYNLLWPDMSPLFDVSPQYLLQSLSFKFLTYFCICKNGFVSHKFFKGNEALLLNKQPKIKYRLIKGLERGGSVFWLSETRNRSPKSHFLSKHPPPLPTTSTPLLCASEMFLWKFRFRTTLQ